MKPKKQKRVRTISQRIVEVELPERKFRHGREQVMLVDFLKNPKAHQPGTFGIRKSNRLTVAAGPTIMKGRLNGGGAEPAWWADHK